MTLYHDSTKKITQLVTFFHEGMLFAKWIRALNSLGLGIKFTMIRHQNSRDNIIRFLIAESKCYLRAKNSHNLTLKVMEIKKLATESGFCA